MGRKTLQITNYSLEEIRELFNTEPKYKVGMRLYAVYQLAKGKPSRQLEEIYNTSFKQICTWANNFNKYGIEGLYDKSRSGRRSKLNDSQKDSLRELITQHTPEEFGFNTAIWSGFIIIEWMKREWNIEYKQAQIYNILKALGLSFQKAKAQYPEADKLAQADFASTIKKTRDRA